MPTLVFTNTVPAFFQREQRGERVFKVFLSFSLPRGVAGELRKEESLLRRKLLFLL